MKRRKSRAAAATNPAPIPPRRDYASLSVKDLLEARDHYHVHLSNLENVTATAIGRYRIHKDDWYAEHPPDVARPASVARITQPRTLANSVVRAWSWPCVLVLLRRWVHREELSSQPDQAVPRALYLPDGRVVPTCVVLAEPDESLAPGAPELGLASGLLGGGYPCFKETQGVFRLGTVACLVEREGAVFALTNQHVAGARGEPVHALVRGQSLRIGASEGVAVGKQTMRSLFPTWPGERTLVTLDAGLVRIEDQNDWTSQVFGIGEIGETVDMTPETIALDLVGSPVRAFGGASGPLEGEIQALFFRYRSLGGFDYVADVLIGPRTRSSPAERTDPLAKRRRTETRPGDSGTLWFYDPPRSGPDRGTRIRRLRPLAMQWGGERFLVDGRNASAFALATFLSTICRVLDVELVRGWSLGHDEYWGKIGHFAIGWKACDRVRNAKLKQLMRLNQRNVGFGDERLAEGSAFRIGRGVFVPLADVPDYVWVTRARSDREGGPRRHEPSQHFADMDGRAADGGPSLLELCRQDGGKLSATVWRDFFRGFQGKGYGPEEGTLPFRVWQIFDAMVGFLRQGDLARFVAAAGTLAHYVGDASQPLHVSELHHGRAPTVVANGVRFPVARDSEAFRKYKSSREYRIHGIYEQQLFEVDPVAALAAINAELGSRKPRKADVRSGYRAALLTFELMSATHKRLPPGAVLDADDPDLSDRKRAVRLWNHAEIRRHTIAAIADSTMLLSRLWESAWREGRGNDVPQGKIKAFSEDQLERVYRSGTFLPALTLERMAASGDYEAPA